MITPVLIKSFKVNNVNGEIERSINLSIWHNIYFHVHVVILYVDNKVSSFFNHQLLTCNMNLLSFLYQAVDAMEMMLLSIIGPVLLCQWYLSSYQEAFITTVQAAKLLLISLHSSR